MSKRPLFAPGHLRAAALATAATMLAGAAALSIAQAPEVFVPELVAIEGGSCLAPAKARPSSLQLAQAAAPPARGKKTAVSPATPAATSAAPGVARL